MVNYKKSICVFFVFFTTIYHIFFNSFLSFLKLAVKNALRYFPSKHHGLLASEFMNELLQYGHIYMYRLVPNFTLRYNNCYLDHIIELLKTL